MVDNLTKGTYTEIKRRADEQKQRKVLNAEGLPIGRELIIY